MSSRRHVLLVLALPLALTAAACSSAPPDSTGGVQESAEGKTASEADPASSPVESADGAEDDGSGHTVAQSNCCGLATARDCTAAEKNPGGACTGYANGAIGGITSTTYCVLTGNTDLYRWGGPGRWLANDANLCTKAKATVRDTLAICGSWNKLDTCKKYTYPAGMVIACGPGRAIPKRNAATIAAGTTCPTDTTGVRPGNYCGQDVAGATGNQWTGGAQQIFNLSNTAPTATGGNLATGNDNCS